MSPDAPRPSRRPSRGKAQRAPSPVSSRRSALRATRDRSKPAKQALPIGVGGIFVAAYLIAKMLGAFPDTGSSDGPRSLLGGSAATCQSGIDATLRASELRKQPGREREAAHAWGRCGAHVEAQEAWASAGWAWLDAAEDAITLRSAESAFRQASQERMFTWRREGPSDAHARASASLGMANVFMRKDTPDAWFRAVDCCRSAQTSAAREERLAALHLSALMDEGWCLIPGHVPDSTWSQCEEAYLRANAFAAKLSERQVANLVDLRATIAFQLGLCVEQDGDDSTRLGEAVTWYERADQLAGQAGNEALQARALLRASAAISPERSSDGDWKRVIDFAGRGERLYEKLENPSSRAAALWARGVATRELGREEEGRALLVHARSLLRQVGETELVAELDALLEPAVAK